MTFDATQTGISNPSLSFANSQAGFGKALSTTANTTSWVNLPDNPASFAANTSWSIRCWFKTTSTGQVLAHDNGTGFGLVFLGVDGSGFPRATVFATGGAGVVVTGSPFAINDNTWRSLELCCADNGTTASYYLFSGTPGGSASLIGSVLGTTRWGGFSTTSAWNCGSAQGNPGNAITALIDEVCFFNTALHTAAFTEATAPGASNRANQTALYRFDGNLYNSNTNGIAAASSVSLIGPKTIEQQVASLYLVTPLNASAQNAPFTGTINLSANGTGGTFNPASINYTGNNEPFPVTFTPTASSSGLGAAINGKNPSNSLTLTPSGTGLTSINLVVNSLGYRVMPNAPYFEDPVIQAITNDLYTRIFDSRTSAVLPASPVGDGVTDDTAALQANLNYISAQAGGGTYYLRSGTYLLGNTVTTSLIIPSNLMLMGDGFDTVITGGTSPGNANGLIQLANITNSGFYNIRFINQATALGPPYTQTRTANNSRFGTLNNFFANGLYWDLGGGDLLNFGGNNQTSSSVLRSLHCDIENCFFDGTKSLNFVSNANWDFLTFKNNDCINRCSRYSAAGARKVRVIGNKFNNYLPNGSVLIVNYTTPYETGGPDLSYTKDLVFQDNVVGVLGRVSFGSNTGESIICQNDGGNPSAYQHFGDNFTVTNVSNGGLTLTDSSKTWPTVNTAASAAQMNGWVYYADGLVVKARSGTNTGNYAYLASHTANSVTLLSPLPNMPTVGDKLSVGMWPANNWLIDGNVFNNNQYGPGLTDGGYKATFSNNNFIDSGEGPYLRASEYALDGNGLIRDFPCWYNTINNNKVRNNRGHWFAAIETQIYAANNPARGNLLTGNQVFANDIKPITYRDFDYFNGQQDPTHQDGVYLFDFGSVYPARLDPVVNQDVLYPGATNGVNFVSSGAQALQAALPASLTGPVSELYNGITDPQVLAILDAQSSQAVTILRDIKFIFDSRNYSYTRNQVVSVPTTIYNILKNNSAV